MDLETVSNSNEREKMVQRTNLETQTMIFASGFLGAAFLRSLLFRPVLPPSSIFPIATQSGSGTLRRNVPHFLMLQTTSRKGNANFSWNHLQNLVRGRA